MSLLLNIKSIITQEEYFFYRKLKILKSFIKMQFFGTFRSWTSLVYENGR